MSRDIDFGSDEENERMGSRLNYLLGKEDIISSFCTKCKQRTNIISLKKI